MTMQAANDIGPRDETVTVGLLLQIVGYGDEQAAELADAEIERRVLAGSPVAITGTLCGLYAAWRFGDLTYPELATRVCTILSAAIQHRQLPAVFRFIGDKDAAEAAHAEFLFLLDHMANRGDEAAAAALVEASSMVPASVLALAKTIRFDLPADLSMETAPPAPPPKALQGDPFADLIPPQPEATRTERLRWWLSDRAWDVRFWFEDRIWDLRMLWWRFQDWREARRLEKEGR